ncbi:E3 ubiquitin-protein ligase RING2-like [Coturnix japonica]|uniref:E3 ubiquitin-protein ligase RING2-like n=1 Tax=Coturnix japonica TaxID=93934 RepID=UPI0013A5C356|nr:E3 ubiquitin-protein ligase RING2-like [Coturnix japonica]
MNLVGFEQPDPVAKKPRSSFSVQMESWKECFMCNEKLVSRRSLGPDPNVAALIGNTCPGPDVSEADQEGMLASIS